MRGILLRIYFTLRYRTLRRVAMEPPHRLLVCGPRSIQQLPFYCPHQGAPLAEGWLQGEDWVCSWHGCKFRLSDGQFIAAKGLRL